MCEGHSLTLHRALRLWATMLCGLMFALLVFVSAMLESPLSEASASALLKAAAADQTSDKSKAAAESEVVPWSEDHPGCTFSRGQDGKYTYGIWSGDMGVILAIDARELQLVHHRIEPILGVLLTVRYRGVAGLDEIPDNITLQFVKHFKVVQSSLDPDSYSEKIQADADALDDETRRANAKHPEEKEVPDARLQQYQKSANELIEFLNANSLRPAHLDRATPEVRGWVFFNTDMKWLNGWKKQEEFVLRFPLAGKIFEFPFKLPPEPGELLLRKRP
jgi:hypothetical protein